MNHTVKRILLSCCIAVLLGSCAGTKKTLGRSIASQLATPFYEHQFTGLLIVDAHTKDTLFNKNAQRYFTPASNTKIFTLYAALKTLTNTISTARYATQNDTLFFQGTGDPSLLHPVLQDSTLLHFLKKQKNIAFYANNLQDTRFGPGWAWEDYDARFAPERSSLPLYGNVVSISRGFPDHIIPDYFKDSLFFTSKSVNRAPYHNRFYVAADRKDTLEVPFKTDGETVITLLRRALDLPVTLVEQMPDKEKSSLYGMAADSLYSLMMQESDNFIAEQLLLLTSDAVSDTLSSKIAIDYALDSLLADLRQPPRWVDGSGLSRYNLFTPESLVAVLQRLYAEVPQERLFRIFPSGGVSGTLEEWYGGSTAPYLYAKSGSLGNIYCLSGYLRTKSGKTLVFSFMNNHYRKPTAEVKQRMQTLFEEIRDTY